MQLTSNIVCKRCNLSVLVSSVNIIVDIDTGHQH